MRHAGRPKRIDGDDRRRESLHFLSIPFALLITNCLISVTWPVLLCLKTILFYCPSLQVPTQISIYYETLCPDSRRFFLHQLAPTYEKLNRFMDVELIPYGHANVSYPRHDNKPVFHCQHGPQGNYNYTLIKNAFSFNLIPLICFNF